MIHLRQATPKDAVRLARIMGEFSEAADWVPKIYSAEDHITSCETMIARGWVRVAEAGGTVLGFLAREGAYVHAIYVAAEAQGQGVGKCLMQAAQAEQDILTLWSFQNNLGAQRFYLRAGFRELRRTMGEGNDENLPDIEYRWERAAA